MICYLEKKINYVESCESEEIDDILFNIHENKQKENIDTINNIASKGGGLEEIKITTKKEREDDLEENNEKQKKEKVLFQ